VSVRATILVRVVWNKGARVCRFWDRICPHR